jgi:hypothetical protein
MRLPGGRQASVYRTIPLCARCDANDPAAQGILAMHAVHPRIDVTTVDAAGQLILEWVDAVVARGRPTYTDEMLSDDVQQWFDEGQPR